MIKIIRRTVDAPPSTRMTGDHKMTTDARSSAPERDRYDRTTLSGAARSFALRVCGPSGSRRRAGVVVWTGALAAFVVLATAATVGASWWREHTYRAAWPALQTAVDHWNAAVATLSPDHSSWAMRAEELGVPGTDLDPAAALTQIATASLGFSLLLAVALLLASRRQRVLAFATAVSTGVSVVVTAGILGRFAPMLPVPLVDTDSQLDPSAYPAALRASRAELIAATVVTDTPAWWSALLGAAVAVVAVLAVVMMLRRCPGVPSLADRPAPIWPGLLVGTLALLPLIAADSEPFGQVRPSLLLLVTCTVAVVSAAAAAAERAGIAVVLSLGALLAHLMLYVAFNRDGGAPGGWGVGTGGPQVNATTTTVVLLVLAPLAGWALASAWAALVRAERHLPVRGTSPTPV